MRIKTSTITTRYELTGPKDAPVVVLSHSLGCNLHMWDPQMTALELHWRVLRYDTRGHGESEAPAGAYTLDELVADAVALLDALAIPRVSFVGLSMGGMIGQGLALRHAERLHRLAPASHRGAISACPNHDCRHAEPRQRRGAFPRPRA